MENRRIDILSDSTGETAEKVVRAAMLQFPHSGAHIRLRFAETSRTEQYMSSKVVFSLIGLMFLAMIALYIYLSGQWLGGLVAAAIMIVIAFFFAGRLS